MMAFHSASGTSIVGVRLVRPAQLTRICTPPNSAIAAYAAYVERDYTECIALCRKSIRQRGDFVGGWRVMAAAAGMAGETAIAAEAMQGYRRSLPDITLALAETQLAVKDPGERKHFLEGLRRAGLE